MQRSMVISSTIEPQGDMAGYQPQSHHLHNRTHGPPALMTPTFTASNPTFDVGCPSASRGIPYNNHFMSSYTTAGSRLDVPTNAYSSGIYQYSH